MRFDFWNNPIVVSSFRVRYRRGGIFHMTTGYMLILFLAGAVINYYSPQFPTHPWQQIYFLGILGLQFIVSPILAAVSTAGSMKSEVVNRTLDFQRIAALSPRQILLGKLLGEPALAYLLAIATIPFAVCCWTLGVPGIGFFELILLYANLFTVTLMFGSLGLLNRLEQGEGKPGANSMGGGWVWAPMLSAMFAFSSGVARAPTVWYAVPAGLLTPLLSMFGTGQGDPWMYGMLLYGKKVSYLWCAPIAELLVAGLCFQCMVRVFLNPLNPGLDKRLSYLVLVLIDLLGAGAVFDRLEPDLGQRGAAFCLVHLVTSLMLITAVTPWRESLSSWVWRFRGRRPRLLDSWMGARAENGMAIFTYCVIGILALFLFLVVPTGVSLGWDQVQQTRSEWVSSAALMVVLILACGTGWQWCQVIMGRSGGGVFTTLLALGVLAPHFLGRFYQEPWLLALTPSAYFVSWILPDSPLIVGPMQSIAPILLLYLLVFGLTRWDLSRRMRRAEQQVDDQLRQMGVTA